MRDPERLDRTSGRDAPSVSATERASVVAARLEAVRGLVAAAGGTGVVLGTRRDFAWSTCGGLNHVVVGSETGVAPILVTAHEAVVLAPVNEAARIRDEEVAGLDIEVVPLAWHDAGAIEREASRRTGGRLLHDDDVATALAPLRSRLGPVEHERMRWLGGRAVAALESALAAVGDGTTEDDAVAVATAQLARDGIRAPVLLAAADGRIAAYRHPIPVGAIVRERLMLVVVAERWGVHAAATRIRELVEPSADLLARQAATDATLEAMRTATRPGVTLGDVFEAGRRAYASAGYADEWTLHHQGGSIGYAPRERVAVPGDETPVEAGMAFAWNPSITGAKAEETFFLDGDGQPEVVTG